MTDGWTRLPGDADVPRRCGSCSSNPVNTAKGDDPEPSSRAALVGAPDPSSATC